MRIWLALAAAFLVMHTSPALAEREPSSGAPLPVDHKRAIPSPITDRFYVRGTFYSPAVNTGLHINPRNAPPGVSGTAVNAERDLGLSSRLYQGRMELMFRLRERNRLRVDYLEVDRSGDHLLARTIVFGDQTFLTNDRTLTSFDWRMFGLTYTYSLYRGERVEIGTGFGAYLVQADAKGEVPARQERQEVSGAGAFPTIPIDFTWRISSRFAVTARAQYLRVSINDSNGWLADIHEDVQYRWKPNFTVGVGYSVVRAALNLHSSSFPGGFAFSLKGPDAFFRVSF